MVEIFFKTLDNGSFLWILPIIACIIYNIILFVILIERFLNVDDLTKRTLVMALNIVLVIILATTLCVFSLDHFLLDTAETHREKILLNNMIDYFKALCTLLIISPITQILIYNLALDFKFAKNNKRHR